MWWFLFLAFLFVLGLFLAGVYVLVEIPAWNRRRKLALRRPKGLDRSGPGSGDGLLRYPRRLEELERQLVAGVAEGNLQLAHLELRATEVGAKEGRAELATRYTHDVELLKQRIASMRRVLGLVWKTRAVLSVRAHLAVTAQGRPALVGFPDPAHLDRDFDRSARAYDAATADVRAFTRRVERRASELADAIPEIPTGAEIPPLAEGEVERELDAVRKLYADLQQRMDALADTFAYLADSCRTRKVVTGAPQGIDIEPGGEALMEEVSTALAALHDMAEIGDQHLADAAVENLAEDIGQLEKVGLEAQAEAEAVLEVERLLDQFQKA
jgi:hypothetical protein